MERSATAATPGHQTPQPATHADQRAGVGPGLHGRPDHPHAHPTTLEGRHNGAPGGRPTGTLQQLPPQPAQHARLLDDGALERLHSLWKRLAHLHAMLKDTPHAPGLHRLRRFADEEEMLSLAGPQLLRSLLSTEDALRDIDRDRTALLDAEGRAATVNHGVQPFIGVIYGPTGCGKSQLIRNLMSSHLISPSPETIFFVAPHLDMIPPQEIMAWRAQICEANFKRGPEDTIVPLSGTLLPAFQPLTYADLLQEKNYDVAHPENVFARAAARGPIAIVMDECMEELGGYRGIAKFFHAFPSKLHDRYPRCTGYAVLVVLHNMHPRKDAAGNISTLKIQAKFHFMSPQMQPNQLYRFINTYTKALPVPISVLLKDVCGHYARQHCYDWIVYNAQPPHADLQWCYLHPADGLRPLCLHSYSVLYRCLEYIHGKLSARDRWNAQYRQQRARRAVDNRQRRSPHGDLPPPPPPPPPLPVASRPPQ
ncbi:IVa2 [Guinea pig adenovirus]|nr:IVa2 [Guinea pig adenovirus]